MKELMNKEMTMTTKEIADLTGKRPGNVRRDAKAMLKGLGLRASVFHGFYKDSYGRETPCHNLPKELAERLLTKYRLRVTSGKVYELGFKEILEIMFPGEVIEYQKKVLNYSVDFYIPFGPIIVEYQEDYHKRETQKKKDRLRIQEIQDELKRITVKEEGNEHLIRVPAAQLTSCIFVWKGKEIEGLRQVIVTASKQNSSPCNKMGDVEYVAPKLDATIN